MLLEKSSKVPRDADRFNNAVAHCTVVLASKDETPGTIVNQ
jgi:hypothetical protein